MATTEINFREIFSTQNLDNLKIGQYQFVRFAREQEVVTISEAKGKRAIAYCDSLKATPALGGEEAAITALFILGHKLLEANDMRLPNAATITVGVFKGLEEDKKGSTEYKAVESTLVGLLVKELSKFALGSAHAKALRGQYAKQLMAKGFRNDADDDDDKDMTEELKRRLRGSDAAKADRLAKQATKPMTYVFAEIYAELEVEWQMRQHFFRKDAERAAIEASKKENERKITHSMGNLLGGLGVAAMGKDGGGRKTTPAEPTLSAEDTAQVTSLLGGLGKPSLKRRTSRSVESV